MFKTLVSFTIANDDRYIGHDFKLMFILKFCLFTILGGIMFTALLLYLSRDTLTTTFQAARIIVRETSFAIMPAVIYTNLIALGTATVVGAIITFWLVHRIRKPMSRFEKDIKCLANGDFTAQIEYRHHDQTTVLAKNINLMTKNFERKIQSIQDEFKRLIESASDGSVPGDLIVSLIRIHRSITHSFKMENGTIKGEPVNRVITSIEKSD